MSVCSDDSCRYRPKTITDTQRVKQFLADIALLKWDILLVERNPFTDGVYTINSYCLWFIVTNRTVEIKYVCSMSENIY